MSGCRAASAVSRSITHRSNDSRIPSRGTVSGAAVHAAAKRSKTSAQRRRAGTRSSSFADGDSWSAANVAA